MVTQKTIHVRTRTKKHGAEPPPHFEQPAPATDNYGAPKETSTLGHLLDTEGITNITLKVAPGAADP